MNAGAASPAQTCPTWQSEVPHAGDPLLLILEELRALRRLAEARQRAEDGTPLSRAELCRVLGIDLKSTLQPLLRAKRIRTVPWTRGEVRIPVGELRRLQREGLPLCKPDVAPPARRTAAKVHAAADARSTAAAIRSINIR